MFKINSCLGMDAASIVKYPLCIALAYYKEGSGIFDMTRIGPTSPRPAFATREDYNWDIFLSWLPFIVSEVREASP